MIQQAQVFSGRIDFSVTGCAGGVVSLLDGEFRCAGRIHVVLIHAALGF
jgi:hypothetical protein